jgi:uncharacterized membrane protein YhaH (DUF805 family)
MAAGRLLLFYLTPPLLAFFGLGWELAGHDTDQAIVIAVVLGLCGWTLVELGFLPGAPGPSRYGPDPKWIRIMGVFSPPP